MRIARFSHNDAIRFGIVDEGELVVLAGDPMFAGYDTTGERVPLESVPGTLDDPAERVALERALLQLPADVSATSP